MAAVTSAVSRFSILRCRAIERRDGKPENDMTDDPSKRPTTQAGATVRYVDRPECTETFVDSIVSSVFDGQTLRLEFGVTRLDEVKQNSPITGRRYPACRLALSPGAAIELINRMQQIAAALTQAGILKPADKPAAP
jgi:hypothetical protein